MSRTASITASIPSAGYVFALLHTADDKGLGVLLVQRHLVRTWAGGRRVRGDVPNWAGQWGLIAARPLVTQPTERTVQGAVLAQTGIDLAAPQSAERYRIIRSEARTLVDRDGGPVTVLLLTCLPQGLAAFAADAQANLTARKVEDGVLARVEVRPVAAALPLVAPCAAPAEGWARFVADHGLVQRSGSPRSDAGQLVRQLSERTAMAPAGARAALDVLAGLPIGETQPRPRLQELRVLGARPMGGDWYQTWSPGEVVLVQALTDPAGAEVTWEGGAPDPLGRPDWRALPRDRLSDPGVPFRIEARLGDQRGEARIAVVPELVGIEVRGQGDGAGVLVRARLAPEDAAAFRHLHWDGGAVRPGEPEGQRLLTAADLAAGGGRLFLAANGSPY